MNMEKIQKTSTSSVFCDPLDDRAFKIVMGGDTDKTHYLRHYRIMETSTGEDLNVDVNFLFLCFKILKLNLWIQALVFLWTNRNSYSLQGKDCGNRFPRWGGDPSIR